MTPVRSIALLLAASACIPPSSEIVTRQSTLTRDAGSITISPQMEPGRAVSLALLVIGKLCSGRYEITAIIDAPTYTWEADQVVARLSGAGVVYECRKADEKVDDTLKNRLSAFAKDIRYSERARPCQSDADCFGAGSCQGGQCNY